MRIRFAGAAERHTLAVQADLSSRQPVRRFRLRIGLEDERDYLAGESLSPLLRAGQTLGGVFPRRLPAAEGTITLAAGLCPSTDVLLRDLLPPLADGESEPYHLWLAARVIAAGQATPTPRLLHASRLLAPLIWKTWVADALVHIGDPSLVLGILEDPPEKPWQVSSNKRTIASILGRIGYEKPGVVSALVAMIRDPASTLDERYAVLRALEPLTEPGPDALDAVIEVLDDNEDTGTNYTARDLLLRWCSTSSQGSALLTGALSHERPGIRSIAFWIAADLVPADPDLVEILYVGLDDPHWHVRFNVAAFLGRLPDLPHEGVARLRRALDDKHSDVRREAAKALGRQFEGGALDHESISALCALLVHPDTWCASAAAEALGKQRDAPPKVIDGLVSSASGEPSSLTRNSVAALGALARSTPGALDALLRLAEVGPSTRRRSALWVLGKLEDVPRTVQPRLRALLGDADPNVRDSAADALVAVGDESPELILHLRSIASSRWIAIQSLGELGDSSPQTMTLLRTIALGPASNEKSAAIAALGQLCRPDNAQAVLETLGAALRSPESGYRQAATHALARLGKTWPAAVSILCTAIEIEENVYALGAIIRALGRLRFAHPEVISFLGAAMTNEKVSVRNDALSALSADVNNPTGAVDAIRPALASRDAACRRAALQELGHVGRVYVQGLEWFPTGFEDREVGNRRSAIWHIDRLANVLDLIVSLLHAAAHDQDPDCRREAQEQLNTLGDPQAAIPALLHDALRDADGEVRDKVLQLLLARFGDDERERSTLVAALRDKLGDRDSRVRQAAAKGLCRVADTSPETVAALLKALGQTGSDNDALVQALGQIAAHDPLLRAKLTQLQDLDELDFGLLRRVIDAAEQRPIS
jgi:HEAT repeat protein